MLQLTSAAASFEAHTQSKYGPHPPEPKNALIWLLQLFSMHWPHGVFEFVLFAAAPLPLNRKQPWYFDGTRLFPFPLLLLLVHAITPRAPPWRPRRRSSS